MAEVTYEDIEHHIAKLELPTLSPGGRLHFTSDEITKAPGDVLKKVCEIYRGVRPILAALAVFPLLPPGFRNAIKAFTGAMDLLCP